MVLTTSAGCVIRVAIKLATSPDKNVLAAIEPLFMILLLIAWDVADSVPLDSPPALSKLCKLHTSQEKKREDEKERKTSIKEYICPKK